MNTVRPIPPDQQEQIARLERGLRDAIRELAEARRERDAIVAEHSRTCAREEWHELQHRVRNMLGVIRSVLRRTLETSPTPEDFAIHFEGRLNALARYQAAGSSVDRRTVELEDVVRDELLPTHCLDTPGCRISGPTVYLEDDMIEPVTLAVHELATNAFKFGALWHAGGRLEIAWTVGSEGDAATLDFHWIEHGVPMVAATPRPRGFGQQYIEEALPYQIGAATKFELRPGGIACSISIPVRRTSDASDGATASSQM